MSREAPVRICESVGVRLPCATRLVVLTNRNPKEPDRFLKEMIRRIGLKVNEKKTRVLNAQKESFDFLGFNFRHQLNSRTGQRFGLMIPSHRAQIHLQATLKKMTSPRVHKKVSEVVEEINPVLRGWVNYFCIGHSARVFSKVRKFTLCRVRRYMRRKQKGKGYGWNKLPTSFFYGTLGLFYEYHVDRS